MKWLLAVPVLLAAAACGPDTPAALSAPPSHSAAAPALPDRALTPGAAGTDITQICPKVNPALEAARPSTAAKARVYAAYRIPAGQRRLYVIDHDISLGLDGKNVPANFWPQPVAEAKLKDRIENKLHGAVCAHRVPLARAQAAIGADWVTAEHDLGLAP